MHATLYHAVQAMTGPFAPVAAETAITLSNLLFDLIGSTAKAVLSLTKRCYRVLDVQSARWP